MEADGSRWNNSGVTECFRSIWTLMKVCGSSWRGWESVNSYASYWSSMKPVQVGGGIPRYIETRESIHRIWSWKLQLMVVMHPVPPIVELVFYFYLLPLKLEASRHFHASRRLHGSFKLPLTFTSIFILLPWKLVSTLLVICVHKSFHLLAWKCVEASNYFYGKFHLLHRERR